MLTYARIIHKPFTIDNKLPRNPLFGCGNSFFLIMAINFVCSIIYVDIFQSLSSTVALSYGSRFIAQLEQRGTGLQWDNMDFKEGGFNFSWCCYMMLIDSAIYFLLGWYLRTAFPGSNFFGVDN